jgi:hypothetical protein
MNPWGNGTERMVRMPPKPSSSPAATLLQPPAGYRLLAWVGLMVNALSIPLVITLMVADPVWQAANIAVGASVALPTAIVGVVASVALLRWRPWGQILAIVALSMSLALALPYGIVRLVLVEQGRPYFAAFAPLFWIVNAGLLIFWCRRSIRTYLH